jgi:hypothetical protein
MWLHIRGVKQPKKIAILPDPEYRSTTLLSKRRELFTQRHGVAFQKAGVFHIVLFHSMKSEKKVTGHKITKFGRQVGVKTL